MRRSRLAVAMSVCSLTAALLLVPGMAFARVGVGVNVGKIDVTQPLSSGAVYELPPIGVINTGDETATYAIEVLPLQGQKELMPEGAWFTFDPPAFEIGPRKVQTVQPRLTLPLQSVPGDYSALFSAGPVKTAAAPGANIAVAAASRLTFTVEQTNFFLALYYRVRDVMQMYSPWSWVALATIVLLAIGIPIARRYRISLGVERRSTPE
jgi:P pilus assembly chaperone PapD